MHYLPSQLYRSYMETALPFPSIIWGICNVTNGGMCVAPVAKDVNQHAEQGSCVVPVAIYRHTFPWETTTTCLEKDTRFLRRHLLGRKLYWTQKNYSGWAESCWQLNGHDIILYILYGSGYLQSSSAHRRRTLAYLQSRDEPIKALGSSHMTKWATWPYQTAGVLVSRSFSFA